MSSDQRDNCKSVSSECPVEDTIYGYVPNMGGNAFYAIIFGVCTLVQAYYLIRYWQKWKGYTILVLLGCLMECGGYACRMLMSKNPWDGGSTSIQFVLLMIGPSFLAAALYMTLRSLVQYFGEQYTKLPARFWTWPFVTADMLGFFTQAIGGIMASMTEKYKAVGDAGRYIMVFGVTFQAVVMAVAGILAIDFALRMRRQQGNVFRHLSKDLNTFLVSLTIIFLVIFTRCIYRIAELSDGVGGKMMRQEVEFMILDGCMITISVILLSTIHPGFYANAIHGRAEHRSKSMRLVDLESRERSYQAAPERYEPRPVSSNRYEM
ncbi:Sphingoid long-chain base transporter RSB1 [Fusarium austroafricanum]|uniref:Sphingoid long-chain base transporter RSB1 n=1 Tax=Fusarium austroafricanum TaxID=2364996 RepID=A0A8H4KXC9_9HYPO|nr:Sphingoid long-chain base transporter RSB1 [Fusarium austroafricanum]